MWKWHEIGTKNSSMIIGRKADSMGIEAVAMEACGRILLIQFSQ